MAQPLFLPVPPVEPPLVPPPPVEPPLLLPPVVPPPVVPPLVEAGWQVCVVSQIGVAGGQSLPLRHWTQVSVTVSQRGVALGQPTVLVALQGTQDPARVPVVSQTGVIPVQSVGMQIRQVSVIASQIGVLTEHCRPSVHSTQRPSSLLPGVASQNCVAIGQPPSGKSSAGLQRRQGALLPVQIGTLTVTTHAF